MHQRHGDGMEMVYEDVWRMAVGALSVGDVLF